MNNHLRTLRADRGWSQADLAAALGVSRQTVNALETGRYDPSLPLAAFQLEWADGRADFDPAAAADRIATALTSALAAEAGHAEPLINGSDL